MKTKYKKTPKQNCGKKIAIEPIDCERRIERKLTFGRLSKSILEVRVVDLEICSNKKKKIKKFINRKRIDSSMVYPPRNARKIKAISKVNMIGLINL